MSEYIGVVYFLPILIKRKSQPIGM